MDGGRNEHDPYGAFDSYLREAEAGASLRMTFACAVPAAQGNGTNFTHTGEDRLNTCPLGVR